MYEKANVIVLDSTSLGDGYAALSALNYEYDDAQRIADYLNESMKNVVTAMLTTAVRDTTLNSVEVHTGDYIGFIDKTMLTSDPDRASACREVIAHLGLEEKYALTIFAGAASSDSENEALEDYIHENYPDVEVYIVDGGQEVYDYIFIAE